MFYKERIKKLSTYVVALSAFTFIAASGSHVAAAEETTSIEQHITAEEAETTNIAPLATQESITTEDAQAFESIETTGKPSKNLPPVIKTGWQQESGYWYYYDQNGEKLTDNWYWLQDFQGNYTWEYLNRDGQAIDQIYEDLGYVWYSQAGPTAGYMTGWQEANGYWYYYRDSGTRVYDWQFIDGSWRYFRPTGTMVTSTWAWLPVNGGSSYNWKFFDSEGRNLDQFFNENGKIWLSQTGPSKEYFKGWWVDPTNNMIYYFRETSGSRVDGWQYIDNDWKFFRVNSGTQAFGFQYIDGNWYYLNDDSGSRVTGLKDIDSDLYYFRNNGSMVNNKFVKLNDGSAYYFESDGRAYTGQRVIDGVLVMLDASTGTAQYSDYVWPVPATKSITSYVGWRWGRYHNGIDIDGDTGDRIIATKAGTVHDTGWDNISGYYVIIRHANNVYSHYYHLSSIKTYTGAKVSSGQLVGLMGNTGRSTGSHLHFELRSGGVWGTILNPMNYQYLDSNTNKLFTPR